MTTDQSLREKIAREIERIVDDEAARQIGVVCDAPRYLKEASVSCIVSRSMSRIAPILALLPPVQVPEGWVLSLLDCLTPEVIDAGAQRLASFEDGSVWPDSWDRMDVAQMRIQAERVIRSALVAHLALIPPVQVPEGRVMVPREPTKKMIEAGSQALATIARAHPDHVPAYAGNADECYRAMIAAAPSPPTKGPGE